MHITILRTRVASLHNACSVSTLTTGLIAVVDHRMNYEQLKCRYIEHIEPYRNDFDTDIDTDSDTDTDTGTSTTTSTNIVIGIGNTYRYRA
jgi:hypothetical protein